MALRAEAREAPQELLDALRSFKIERDDKDAAEDFVASLRALTLGSS